MKVRAIVLAAGASTRMGRPKQLLPLGSTTLLGSVLDGLVASRIDSVTVVLGHHAEEVRASISDRPISFVVNPVPERGMLSSIKVGIESVSDAEAYLIVLGDQPLLKPDVVDSLMAASECSPHSLFVPVYEGKRGHPLLIRSVHRQEILSLPETVGLNTLVHSHVDDLEEVPTDSSGVLHDVDTPEDYDQIRFDGGSPGAR